MARPTVRNMLLYLESTTFLLFLLRQTAVDLDDLEARLGTATALERLSALEVGGLEGWRLLARLARHVLVECETQGDPRAVIVRQLHADLVRRADAAAALVAPKKEV